MASRLPPLVELTWLRIVSRPSLTTPCDAYSCSNALGASVAAPSVVGAPPAALAEPPPPPVAAALSPAAGVATGGGLRTAGEGGLLASTAGAAAGCLRIGSLVAEAYCRMLWPPSQSRTTPVTNSPQSKKSSAAPMSSGAPTRCSGSDAAVFESIAAFVSGSIRSKRSVSQNPGERQFTRSRGPQSSARLRVSPTWSK